MTEKTNDDTTTYTVNGINVTEIIKYNISIMLLVEIDLKTIASGIVSSSPYSKKLYINLMITIIPIAITNKIIGLYRITLKYKLISDILYSLEVNNIYIS